MQDFTGFQFGNHHSSALNILRVSDGSRYNDTLVPGFKDVTAERTGSDGTLYWESFYNTKSWSVPVVFDSLTEAQYRTLRQVFTAKQVGELIFDECPYKAYTAKVQSAPQFKTVCFNQDDTRIYKGEGTIQFIAYYPFAHSVHKYLDEYSAATYTNKDEWKAASGMKDTKGSYDGTSTNSILVYNAGDLEIDWKAFFPLSSTSPYGSDLQQINLTDTSGNIKGNLYMSGIVRQNELDTQICINSKTNLIEGCYTDSSNELIYTGSLYNKFITAGDFFKIPLGGNYNFNSVMSTDSEQTCASIEYNYLYY